MKIVFVASECVPFASTGGLGDVVGALPKALAEHGHEAIRILPLYRSIREGGYSMERLGLTLEIPVGLQRLQGETFLIRHDGVDTYLIRRDEFFDRSHLYSMAHRDYDDNFSRFIFFQKAAVELMDRLGLKADVVHAHDWQAGLLPFYLRYGVMGTGRSSPLERSIFTIHNLAFQGVFSGSDFPLTGLPYNCFATEGGMEFYGQISCMKAGIISADRVTTVSPTYAREIQTVEGGMGLEGVLSARADAVVGLLNGIDAELWNPATDSWIKSTYDAETVTAGKAANKLHVQRKMRLPQRDDRPLIGMVTRLSEQKGIDLVTRMLPELMKMDVQFALLGSGAEVYEEECMKWPDRWPEACAVRLGFDPKLAHRLYAGCDLMLVPSVFEPCGLSQMYAMRYGSLPVVHRTGGLADTVVDETEHPGEGTGFLFQPYEGAAFLDAIERACLAWLDEPLRLAMQQRCMARDASWSASALGYERLYEALLTPPPP